MGIIKIVQGLSKMLHETIVDDYVKIVNFPLYTAKSGDYSALRSVGYLPNCFLKQVEK